MAPPLDRVVERPELGVRLVAALTESGRGEVGLTTRLHGAGGFGKTTLAAWACHQPQVRRAFPGGLLWVTVGQDAQGTDLTGKINDLSFMISGRRPSITDQDAAGAELGRLLQEREPVLLVIDDVWTEAQLRPFRFGAPSCTRLVTTRRPELLGSDGPRIAVDAMTGDQARELVTDGVAGLGTVEAGELAAVAGRWPVLLNLVNGVLRRRVAHGEEPAEAVRRILGRLRAEGPAALDPSRPEDRNRAVAATVTASLALLSEADQQRYLDLAVFPEDVEVPVEVLALVWPDGDVDALCEELLALGLVAEYRLDAPGARLVMHDVMHAYVEARNEPPAKLAAHRRVVAAAAGLLPPIAGADARPWWSLPDDADYLWRYLPHHLHHGEQDEALAALVCDLRWVEARTRRLGSVLGALEDLALVNTPTARALADALSRDRQLLGPIEPAPALGATLASRLLDDPELEVELERYQATLPRPRLVPLRPLPGRPDPATTSGAPVAGHIGGVTSCAFSPDGTLLATTGDDAAVLLWHPSDGTHRPVLDGHTGGVWDCAFSPDGTLLASASNDHTARLWRVADETVHLVLSHADRVTSCAFSPDGTLLATSCADGTARMWHVGSGQPSDVVMRAPAALSSCTFSPDGDVLATGTDGSVDLWDVRTGLPVRVLAGHTGRVTSCAFSPDGTLLATTCDDGTIRVWDLATGDAQTESTLGGRRAWRCAFSPDGSVLAAAGGDGCVALLPMPLGTGHHTIQAHDAGVFGCAFSPDGTTLATTGLDQAVRLWRTADRTRQAELTTGITRVNRCAFSPDGRLLATTTITGVAELHALADPGHRLRLTGHVGGLRGCAFSPDSRLVATSGNDNTTRIWYTDTGELHRVLRDHTDWVWGCAFAPDGHLVATTSKDATARLWRVDTGSTDKVLTGHTRLVTSCSFSPDGRRLATSSDDGTARIWNVDTGVTERVLTGHDDLVNRCATSPDGSLLATASDDGTLRLWRIGDGTCYLVLRAHTSWVDACTFSPDGRALASAGHDGTVRIWELPTGRPLCALRVAGPIVGLDWHPHIPLLCAVGGAGTHLLRYEA